MWRILTLLALFMSLIIMPATQVMINTFLQNNQLCRPSLVKTFFEAFMHPHFFLTAIYQHYIRMETEMRMMLWARLCCVQGWPRQFAGYHWQLQWHWLLTELPCEQFLWLTDMDMSEDSVNHSSSSLESSFFNCCIPVFQAGCFINSDYETLVCEGIIHSWEWCKEEL